MGEANAAKHGFFQIDKVLEEIAKDDQEEWEYEYSTTETDTYYLTLDLSHPDFKEKPRRANHHRGRGIYHGVRAPDRADTERAKATRKSTVQEDEVEQDGGEEDAGDDEAGPTQGKEKEGSPDEDDQDDKALRDVQIMDFHTQNPLIGYRGRYFEGSWAEIIGTEALLLPTSSLPSSTSNSSSSQILPILRQLPDDISLLAMSASKIITKERATKPPASKSLASLEGIKKEFNIRIPVGKDTKRGERREQGRFLENLMAVKRRRGEGDLVTVYARGPVEDGTGRGRGQNKGKGKGKEKEGVRRGRGRVGKRAGRVGGGGIEERNGNGNGGSRLSEPTPRSWDVGRGSAGPSGSREEEDVAMSG